MILIISSENSFKKKKSRIIKMRAKFWVLGFIEAQSLKFSLDHLYAS